jgi:elongation factor 3
MPLTPAPFELNPCPSSTHNKLHPPPHVQKASTDKKSAIVRTAAAATLLSLAKTVGRPSEPYLIPALTWCLELVADKETAARDAATQAITYISTEVVAPASICKVMPELLGALEFAKKWQTKVLALQMVSNLTKSAPTKVQKEMPSIIPAVTPCMNDSKAAVADQAFTTMGDVCKVCGADLYLSLRLPPLASCGCSTMAFLWTPCTFLFSSG